MFRRLATAALLVPLAFNGLWMVCADKGPAPSEARASATASETPAHCTTMCVKDKGKLVGSGCFITAGDANASIAMFLFGVATLCPTVDVVPPTTVSESIPELAVLYSNPALSDLTPPPKA